MQFLESFGQRKTEANRFIRGQTFVMAEITLQCPRLVARDVDLAPGHVIVRQLHTVIEIFVRTPDVENVDEAGVPARDRLESRHAFELAPECALTFECA